MPASSVNSLTDEELSKCSFTGQRWMYIVAPEPDFQMDEAGAETLFRSFTDTVLVSDSKLGETLKTASDAEFNACIEYRKKTLGKYELHSASVGKSVSAAEVQTRLKELSDRIRAYRGTAEGKDAEVQVLIFVTSHGDNYDRTYPTNAIVLGTGNLPYDQFVGYLYKNLMTKCRDASCAAVREHLADEVVVLMDNCFSGGFNDALKTYQATTTEYRGQIDAPGGKLTRIVALSAAYRQQVATGGVPTTQQGTLVTLFREMLTNWSGAGKDGMVSWYDVKQFMPVSAAGHFTESALSSVAQAGAGLACPARGQRRKIYSFIDENPAYFGRLFANTMATLKTEMPPTAGAMANNLYFLIQTPVFSSNLSDALLQKYAFAATSSDAAGTSQTAQDFLSAMKERAATAEAKLPAQVSLLQKLYQYLKKNPGVLDAGGTGLAGATPDDTTGPSPASGSTSGAPAATPTPTPAAKMIPVAGSPANSPSTTNAPSAASSPSGPNTPSNASNPSGVGSSADKIEAAALGLGSDENLLAAYQRVVAACEGPIAGGDSSPPTSPPN